MKNSPQRRVRRQSWEGNHIEVVMTSVEEKIMNQIIEEIAEVLYLEFSQFQEIKNISPAMGCSSPKQEDIA